ncbi:hypothetical protein D9O36_10165 [Zobellia amurskyensis]|uniref:Uncharacterized protein n=1 Tax=Zobellia amurskyensis TaxID=248905 RepID=A0A7X2ZTP5_9FLAO|nr:hypothetical protein [Zobellia amurskyensis]MUH36206.1 hypothetical protein [Zobellia amurskyensis]
MNFENIIEFITQNYGLFIFLAAITTISITIYFNRKGKPEISITAEYKNSSVGPTEYLGNVDSNDNVLKASTKAIRDLFCNITIDIRNHSKRTAFNVQVIEINRALTFYTQLKEKLNIASEDGSTFVLQFKKTIVGEKKDIENPDYLFKQNLENDLMKLGALCTLKYEDAKGNKTTAKFKYPNQLQIIKS